MERRRKRVITGKVVPCFAALFICALLTPARIQAAGTFYQEIEIGITDSTDSNRTNVTEETKEQLRKENQPFLIEDGVLTYFLEDWQNTEIVIPDGVKAIGSYAFSNRNITSVLIPDSVTVIYDYAFRDCSSLQSVTMSEGTQQIKLGKNIFLGCSNLKDITFRKGTLFEETLADIFNQEDKSYNPFVSGFVNLHVKDITTKEAAEAYPFGVTIVDDLTFSLIADKTLLQEEGETISLHSIITPDFVVPSYITYESDNPNVVEVTNDGIVTAKKEGSATIMAYADVGENKSLTATVMIVVEYPIKKIEQIQLSNILLELEEGEKASITASFSPYDVEDKTLIWESSNSSVATVNNGRIEAVSAGFATITCSARGNPDCKAICSVTVKPKDILVEKISISYAKNRIEEDEVLQLKAAITPSNATNQKLLWKSSNKAVAKISSNGEVKGLSSGKTTITCYSLENPDISEEVVIYVTEKKETVLVCDEDDVTLKKGSTYQMEYEIWPVQNITFQTDNPKVATVSSTGLVTVVGKGIAVITLEAEDGTTTECKISGVIKPTKLTINKKKLVLEEGDKYKLSVRITPVNVSKRYRTLKWTTNNKKVAKVTQTGKVYAVGTGACTIQAKTANGITVKCRVVVEEKVEEEVTE